jgi:alpha-galactosidase
MEREATWERQFKEMLDCEETDLERGDEYAAYIFNALFGDHTPFEFNGNLTNDGIISNLPPQSCVEAPVLASREGIRPFCAGPLPEHLAILVNTTARCENLAVEAAMDGDWMKIYHSILFDPLTSAVLSMEEIRTLTVAMFEKNKDYLAYFRSFPDA